MYCILLECQVCSRSLLCQVCSRSQCNRCYGSIASLELTLVSSAGPDALSDNACCQLPTLQAELDVYRMVPLSAHGVNTAYLFASYRCNRTQYT